MDKKEAKPRRRRSKQERRRIVEESLQPGVSVARLARAHQVNANQIFHWRKLYREGLLADEAENAAAEWLPVRLANVSPEQPHQAQPAQAPGAIEVELARGRVRIEGAPDAGALRLVLELLGA
jgi:transposase